MRDGLPGIVVISITILCPSVEDPAKRTVRYCHSPRGSVVTTADEATLCNKEKADRNYTRSNTPPASRPLPSVSLPRALIYLLVSPQSYRNTFTMADSDLAPDFAPFFSFVSGLASSKLGMVQLTVPS